MRTPAEPRSASIAATPGYNALRLEPLGGVTASIGGLCLFHRFAWDAVGRQRLLQGRADVGPQGLHWRCFQANRLDGTGQAVGDCWSGIHQGAVDIEQHHRSVEGISEVPVKRHCQRLRRFGHLTDLTSSSPGTGPDVSFALKLPATRNAQHHAD